MDSMDIPPRFRQRNSRLESRPPLTDEEARENKEMFSGRPGMAVENNRLRRMMPIAQVYSLQFLQFGEDDLHQLYGTVSVGLAYRAEKIFDRQVGNGRCNHAIDQKGYARLSGPMRPINGQANIVIYPRLFKKNESGGLFHPARIDEVRSYDRGTSPDPLPPSPAEIYGIQGQWLLTERELNDDVLHKQPHLEMPHNKILRHEVETTVGPIAVTYSVFRDGMEAFLRIKLLKWRKELGQANIYGTVSASSAMLNDPEAKSFVLDLKRDEHTPVKAHQFIPLQRPSIVVPKGFEFKLDLCIKHRDLISGNDRVVAKDDNRTFTPKCWFEGSDEYIRESVDVSSDFCLLQVEVFWTPWWAIR